MAKKSAGLLMYRRSKGALEVLLVHLGGPYWARKDDGAWTIPKGELAEGEDEFAGALREFQEETGFEPGNDFIPLGTVRHKSGKKVTAWAFEGDCDPTNLRSNTFSIEWPPKSGQMRDFPEVDRACFWTVAKARDKILRSETDFLDRLVQHVQGDSTGVDIERDSPNNDIGGTLFDI